MDPSPPPPDTHAQDPLQAAREEAEDRREQAEDRREEAEAGSGIDAQDRTRQGSARDAVFVDAVGRVVVLDGLARFAWAPPDGVPAAVSAVEPVADAVGEGACSDAEAAAGEVGGDVVQGGAEAGGYGGFARVGWG